jgi:lipopolysaccharide export system permease protein
MVGAAILGRYVIGQVLLAVLLVCLLLAGLYTLIDFIREARSLDGDYGFGQMLWYLAQTSPRRLYDIFPFAALIGTLLGLGSLAAGNELVAMRAAGFDRRQLVVRVLMAIALCLIVLVLVSERLIPGLELSARADREQARTGQVHVGLRGTMWLRDGEQIMRIGRSAWISDDRIEFSHVLVYRLIDGMRPVEVIVAERAMHDGQQWRLFHARSRDLNKDLPIVESDERLLQSGLSPDLFAATVSRPRLLAMGDLLQMRAFLKRNGLDAEAYEQALWTRVFYPINVLAMVLIGLPFVFRNARQGGRGLNLFAGVALGLLFFILTRLAQGVSGIVPAPIWFSSLLPAVLIVVLAGVMLKRH